MSAEHFAATAEEEEAKEALKSNRQIRCARCRACTASDCGACPNCMDMPKFGGPGMDMRWPLVPRRARPQQRPPRPPRGGESQNDDSHDGSPARNPHPAQGTRSRRAPSGNACS
ncbi:hypothetical protein T492DRAFT_437493 [Pavlovales sp. CCMP2436]|nr:hypothetical protein T492DRAFT_437493 [Pavlovales sp. CCMP2436]